MDYRDIQLQALRIAPAGAQLITTVNGANGRMNGLEAEVSFKPHKLLTLNASAGYNDFHYTRVDSSTGISPNNSLPYTPKSTYNIAAQFDLPLGKDWGQLTLGTSYNYRTRVYLDTGNIDAVAQPGYGLLSARLNWQAPEAHWNVYLYGKNLTNAYYRVYSVPELFSGLAPTAYGPSREIGLGMKTAF
jgi:iron complex outermembrane receptor protein